MTTSGDFKARILRIAFTCVAEIPWSTCRVGRTQAAVAVTVEGEAAGILFVAEPSTPASTGWAELLRATNNNPIAPAMTKCVRSVRVPAVPDIVDLTTNRRFGSVPLTVWRSALQRLVRRQDSLTSPILFNDLLNLARGDHDILDCMEIDDAARAHFDELSKRNLTAFRVEKISEPLNQIPVAIYNRIQRERRRDLGEPLSLCLEMMIRVCGDTWRTARFLSSNALEHGREVEFLFAVPPLTRTILDALLTVVFMFDDPAMNVRRYYAGAWRDRYEEHHRLVQAHGTDSAWATRLRVNMADIDQIAILAGIRQEERDNLDRCLRGDSEEKPLVSYWPSSGKFGKSFQVKNPKRAKFLRHMNGFYYGALSQDSHLGFRGLQRRGGMYAQPADGFDLDQHHIDCRTEFMAEMLTIYSALLSELSCQLALEHEKRRLRDDVWAYLDHSDFDAAGLYRERYEEWLR